jgi:hypothetical protein
MLELRASGMLDKYENRPTEAGALNFFKRDGEGPMSIITQDMRDKARQAFSRDLKVPVINYDGGISIGSTRTVTIADSRNTSAFVTVAFTTYSFGFTQVPAAHMNNEIALQEDFNRSMLKYTILLEKTMDAAAVAALDAAKTQVFGDALGYDTTGDVLGFTLAQDQEALGALDPVMQSNDYFGPLHIIGNQGVHHLVNQMSEKAEFNSENKTIQFLDKELYWSNRIANAASHKATGFAVAEGSAGLLYRFEREAELGTVSQVDGYTWGISQLPLLGIPVGTMEYESVGDLNAWDGAATADLTRGRKQHFGFAVDVAYVVAYNSNQATIPSPIIKFDIADS